MSIRVYDNSDFEGEEVTFSTKRFYLGEAEDYAIKHKCNIMIRSCEGWSFKYEKVDLSTNIKPEKVVDCRGKEVYIMHEYKDEAIR
jgi:GH43 family beta-xylosidase